MNKYIEILAPAGNEQMLHAAVMAGANAVYLGLLQFSARSSATNFDEQSLKSAVQFCRARNVKVYIALNTIVFPSELSEMANSIQKIAAIGADAVIVQDLSVATLVKQMAPSLSLHGSTQMSVHSLEGAIALKNLGFTRVILSRELSFDEIKHITENCGIETEVFVHGALCVCVSGQCYMSAFYGGRSGNRGACAGPCRLPFSAQNSDTAFMDDSDDYHLSLKDMSHIKQLKNLAKTGVSSIKIEGRLRSPEYAAACVNACKKTLQNEEYDEKLLQDVFSRSGFTNAYLSGEISENMFGTRTKEDSVLAKKAEPQLRELFRRELQSVPVKITVNLNEQEASLVISDEDGNSATAKSEVKPQTAQKNQEDAIIKSASKLGTTPFYLKEDIVVNGAQFYLPASQLNEMRRVAAEELLSIRSEVKPHECKAANSEEIMLLTTVPSNANLSVRKNCNNIPLYVYLSDISQLSNELLSENIKGFIVPIHQHDKISDEIKKITFLSLPRFCARPEQEKALKKTIEQTGENFAGFYAQNISHINMCKNYNIFGGFGLNVTNALSCAKYSELGATKITMSLEQTLRQMQNSMPTKQQLNALNTAEKDIETSCIIYGHMPLMITRSCPLLNVTSCKNCTGEGYLKDRKDMKLYVKCSAPLNAGARTIYNAVPIYMGDRLHEITTNSATAYFTNESKDDVLKIVKKLINAEKFDDKYTRGLYEKGVLSK